MKLNYIKIFFFIFIGDIYADEVFVINEPSRVFEARFDVVKKKYYIVSFEPLLPKINESKISPWINKKYKRQIIVFKNKDLSVEVLDKDIIKTYL